MKKKKKITEIILTKSFTPHLEFELPIKKKAILEKVELWW